jgi:sRNA-binding regulator protein Hfq
MRKFFSFLVLISLLASMAQADTIHLKNGSVIKGKVTSFADDQFIVLIDTGGGRQMSRAMIYMGDVSRIEFDSAPPGDAGREPSSITAPPATESSTRDTQTRTSTPIEPPPITREPSTSPPTRDPEPAQPEKSTEPEKSPTTAPPVAETSSSETSSSERTTRKPTGPVKTQTVDVMARRDWTSTGLIIKRGDRIRITAAGSVTLDQASGRTSGPEGIELTDPRKLMGDQPTGALIGVIGADNDDFIFIGASAEFTATRDGLLFLSVNEGALSDNSGSYKAVIEVESQSARK